MYSGLYVVSLEADGEDIRLSPDMVAELDSYPSGRIMGIVDFKRRRMMIMSLDMVKEWGVAKGRMEPDQEISGTQWKSIAVSLAAEQSKTRSWRAYWLEPSYDGENSFISLTPAMVGSLFIQGRKVIDAVLDKGVINLMPSGTVARALLKANIIRRGERLSADALFEFYTGRKARHYQRPEAIGSASEAATDKGNEQDTANTEVAPEA